MEVKLLEIRDRMTFSPVFAFYTHTDNEKQWRLLRASGYGLPLVVMGRLQGGPCHHDPYEWNDRTFKEAHLYIQDNWHSLKKGEVVDVEFIKGETDARSEERRVGKVC